MIFSKSFAEGLSFFQISAHFAFPTFFGYSSQNCENISATDGASAAAVWFCSVRLGFVWLCLVWLCCFSCEPRQEPIVECLGYSVDVVLDADEVVYKVEVVGSEPVGEA